MKIRSEARPDPFTPIVFHVTVETEDELNALWHRLDVGIQWLMKRHPLSDPPVPFPAGRSVDTDLLTEEFFVEVDEVCVARGARVTGTGRGHHPGTEERP